MRTSLTEVSFPLPPEYPAGRYLQTARVIPGHEAGGPTAHLSFTTANVIGLRRHHLSRGGLPTSMQLVLEVPVWLPSSSTTWR